MYPRMTVVQTTFRTLLRAAVLALLIGVPALAGPAAVPLYAQDSAGVCEGNICGPSGSFSPESFPTLTAIVWEALPRPIDRTMLAPAPGGRTLYVAPESSGDGSAAAPFGSLNDALAAAQPGDLIWVADGLYPIGTADDYEGLIVDTPDLTIMAERPGSTILVPRDPAQHGIGIAARADNLIIDGFVIRGFSEAGIEYGNTRTPQHNLRLQHLIVEQSSEGIRSAYGGSGAQPLVDGMAIYDVWLRDISLIALQCGEGPCNNLRWEALQITMEGGAGDSSADGIAVETGENIVVFNAHITNIPGDGIDLKTSTGVIANVIVHHTGGTGLKLWYGGDIINALIYRSNDYAAISLEVGEFRILNTLVARHAWGDHAYAMSVAYDHPQSPGRIDIINSVFFQNSGALWLSPGFELNVQNTLLTGSANGEELVWGGLIIGTENEPVEGIARAGAGADNLPPVDPQFNDPDADDYRLQAASPLIDAGTSAVPLPPFDLYGGPRVNGAAVDLGPIEWAAPEQ